MRAQPTNGVVAVSVADHGPGISPEDQRLIFEKFGRATTGRARRPAPASGSSSPARSPRRTAARSRSTRSRAPARPSRCASRRAPSVASRPRRRFAGPSVRLRLARAAGDGGAQILGGSITTASPRKERISPTSQSALPTDLLERLAVRERSRAALDSPRRDLRAEEDARRPRRRSACSGSRSGRGSKVSSRQLDACACGRAGSSAARPACGPSCGRTTRGARARGRAARSCARSDRSLGVQVLDLDDAVLRRSPPRACGRSPPPRCRPRARRPRAARTGRTSPRACGARGRAACAPRRRSSGRRTRARAGSPAPRAASGAAAGGTCRRRAPSRRGPRRPSSGA